MSNEINGYDDGLDGFGDSDGVSRLIKGTKLKFTNDFKWVTGDGTEIAADREFIPVGVVKVVQKWIDNHPVETQVLGAHEKFPDINRLNDEAPREEWTEKFGKEVGPWQTGYAVYLLDPLTMQLFTFPTSTIGGGQAVRDLRETVGMARRLRGENICPRVHLGDVFMKNDYGGRQRPAFDIIGYQTLGNEKILPPVAAPEPPKPIAAPPPVKQTEPSNATVQPAAPKPAPKPAGHTEPTKARQAAPAKAALSPKARKS